MNHRMKIAACAGLIAAIFTGTLASAQGHGGMMPGMGMMGMGYGMMGSGCAGAGGGMMGRPGMMRGPGMMHGPGFDLEKADELLNQRLDALKKELGIGDKQEAAWKAYAEAVQNRFTTMRGMHDSMHATMSEGSAVERLETRVGMMETMLESMKALVPAVKALYEAVPDEKKERANALLGGCGMM